MKLIIILSILIVLINLNILQHSCLTEDFALKRLCKDNKKYCEKHKITLDNKNKIIFKNGSTASYKDINNPLTNYTCINKDITSSLLKNNNISVPNYYLWDASSTPSYNLQKINNLLHFPLVVKPTIGTQGYGIKTNIYNNEDLFQHISHLLKDINNIIIEEQITGNDYRVTVFKGEIMGIVQRNNPTVIGDGSSSLKSLINKHKHSKYKPHNIDNQLLSKQNVNMNTIIPNNKKIRLSTISNFHNGATISNVPLNTVHPDNLQMFKRVNQLLDKNISGIDFISNNLSIPFYQQGAVIEVNSRPDIVIHTYTFNKKENEQYIDSVINKLFN